MPPAPRIRPYKDFLTPLLHRRFAKATSSLALLCYLESLFIGGIDSWFWSWFPVGRVGIRAALLFIPAFMIFILRVGQLHVGLRTSFSAWQTFTTFPKPQIVQTFAWYLLSAYVFSEVYLWSAPKEADFGRIKSMPKTDRPVLNEKPIYVTSYLLILGVVQAALHLFFDYDRIEIQVSKSQSAAPSTQDSHMSVPPADRLRSSLPQLATKSAKRAAVVAVLAPVVYSFPIPIYPYSMRNFAWGITRFWAKIFYNLPKSTTPPSIRPFHLGVLGRTLLSGFLLVSLWELGNAAFSIYVALQPLKNERPITYESRDPNGSLLTGLKGKKLQTRAFAFWELVYIAQRFEGRRKAIYEDIDRSGGSMWSQILAVCLEVVTDIERRIADYETPAPPTIDPSLLPPKDLKPRLTEPLASGFKEPEDLFSSIPQKPKSYEVNLFSRGKVSNNAMSPRAKQLKAKAEDALLTSEQKDTIKSDGFVGFFRDSIKEVLRYPIGRPFRQEYRRRVAAVVLGQPHGDVGVIIDAIDSLTRFAVFSLTEDRFGNVQRDVKQIIRTFTTAIIKVEQFTKNFGSHWTDVDAKKESPEVDSILLALKGGLNELVDAFGGYSEDLRLSQSAMREAREAATLEREPDMEQRTG